jgi:hypothetical protein
MHPASDEGRACQDAVIEEFLFCDYCEFLVVFMFKRREMGRGREGMDGKARHGLVHRL